MQSRTNWILVGTLAVSATTASHTVRAAHNCEDLVKLGLFPNTIVQTAKDVPADGKIGMPSFCEVTATITPIPGSKITAVYRLPQMWNGRMLGLGGGGWTGVTDLRMPMYGPVRTADAGLPRGYATAQTDGGHSIHLTPDGFPVTTDASWTCDNPVAVTDFAHRAVHQMTVVGKEVIAAFCGRGPTKSYFQGCSTGGRMGMMETQRYPEDYDGVIAGAPVYSLLVQSSSAVRDQIFRAPGAAIPPELMKLVHEAVLSACDGRRTKGWRNHRPASLQMETAVHAMQDGSIRCRLLDSPTSGGAEQSVSNGAY